VKIVFRTDASLKIGTGHVMRCLGLARALRVRGAQCHFICREHIGNLIERIFQEGFEVISLPLPHQSKPNPVLSDESILAHAHWLGTDWQTDADQTVATLRDHGADWLIVDHYALDHRWESQLRPFCRKIMAIDDLADRRHDCDLLLDQNLVGNQAHRYDGLLPARCARLLGPQYALLQPPYAELHPRTPPRLGPVRRILAYFGGADNQNLTGSAIAAFLRLNRADITLDVVINPETPHAETLRTESRSHANIALHEGMPSLAHLMVQADLAVGAAGATSWERCCLGLPALVVTLADNQVPIAEELHRLGVVRWLGNVNSVSVSALSNALLEVCLDDGSLSEWSTRCRATVDGRGIGRVSEILLLNSTTPLNARPACLDDEMLLLQWANDPLVRDNAFCAKTIDELDHRTWYYRRLRSPETCQIYILETKLGTPIGQVRFEYCDGVYEIDYSLAAIARGRGLGAPLLRTAMLAFRQSREGSWVFGRVKSGNFASRKVFESLGFSASATEGGQFVYRNSL